MQVAVAINVAQSKGGVTSEIRSEMLDLSAIRADQRAQPREHLNTATTEAYAEDMAAGANFPPLTVFHDGDAYWLADGFHRRYAAISLGLVEFHCEVRSGALRDAILFSCQVNAIHGVPRTNEDKRRAVMKLLEDDEWSHWSNSEISKRAKVNDKTVAKLRSEIAPPSKAATTPAEFTQPRTFTTKHGTVSKMKTAAIGRAEQRRTNRPAATAARPVPQRGREAICDRVREAIIVLSGLPPATEVAQYFAGTGGAITISERLPRAALWLADFNSAWKDDQC